jgi:hypothetical protein
MTNIMGVLASIVSVIGSVLVPITLVPNSLPVYVHAVTWSYSMTFANRDGGFSCRFESSSVEGGVEKICSGLIADQLEVA